jgi:hypothetical protein
MSMDEPQSKAQKKQHQKIQSVISNFLESVKDDVMAKTLFHLAIFISTASDSYSTKFDSCHLPFGGLTLSSAVSSVVVKNHVM